MPTDKQKEDQRRWLIELTGIPTAAGREHRVIDWITAWAQRRRNVQLRRDGAGNLVITRRGTTTPHPVFITAHMDHPAFVVRKVLDDRSRRRSRSSTPPTRPTGPPSSSSTVTPSRISG
ncbi:MAG: hypothetical protein ACYSU7_19890 [Planctomycetota bacterium]|jgi:hypothetical protein